MTRVFGKRRHHAPQPPELEDYPWWEQLTPSTTDDLLHQLGLDALIGTGPDQLAALLEGPTVLNWRESHVLRLRLGLDRGGAPRSVREITRELGVAESRIHQVEAKALAKLRQHSGRLRSP